MSDANLNAWWCRLLAEGLVAAGVERVVLCPGNRNVPLLFALDAQPGLQVLVHQEERSAAFLALGICQATGRPAAVCTTSGSAVVNCLPAVAEALYARLPLVVLAADRPPELIGCGAPQAMRQVGVWDGLFARSCALPPPSAETSAAADMRRQVATALAELHGPLQIDLPFREPLAPIPDPRFQAPADPPPAALPASRLATRLAAIPPATAERRGAIVVGARCPLPAAQLQELAGRLRWPLIADAGSGCRRPALANLISTADALCTGALARERLDLLIRVGEAPLARPVYEWCGRQRCPVLRLDDYAPEGDFLHSEFLLACHPTAAWLEQLASAWAAPDAAWLQRWLNADASARHRRDAMLAEAEWGEHRAAAMTIAAAASADFLHLANSMSIRHGNLLLDGSPQPLRIGVNRGLNGIDGTMSTFLGGLVARPRDYGLLLCGDLAFLHDLPALAAASQQMLHGAIVVINNCGGGIFDLLPVAQLDRFQDLVRAPAAIDIQASARQFGLASRRCLEAEELQDALAWSRSRRGICIIEAQVPAEGLRETHLELLRAMAEG